jgi:integrase/recombinase XerD
MQESKGVVGGAPGGAPVEREIESFAAALASAGYAEGTVHSKIRWLSGFGRWLACNEAHLVDLDEAMIARFFEEQSLGERMRGRQGSTARQFLAHLREKGVASAQGDPSPTSVSGLVSRYEHHLRAERALRPSTTALYGWAVQRFLTHRFASAPPRVEELRPSDGSNFILEQCRSQSPATVKVHATAVRSFFRFLLQRAEIEVELTSSILPVANWRAASVPKFLPAEEVEQVLAAVDRRDATGLRDYAILVLLARLGLRAGEVVRLRLEDIDWRAGELLVRGKAGVQDRLPLLEEVGAALAAYLEVRPPSSSRCVFVRARAPYRGFATVHAIGTIASRALRRGGLPRRGAHVFRHSLATAMLRRGASMDEVAEVLRHRSLATTEIYAKVDFEALRALARRWPGSGGAP